MPQYRFAPLGSSDMAALAELLALTTDGKIAGVGRDGYSRDADALAKNITGQRQRMGLYKPLSPGDHYDATNRFNNERVSTEPRTWPESAGPQPDWWSGQGPNGAVEYNIGSVLRDKLLAMLSSK